MKYIVKVRRYETVIRDVEIVIETNGRRKAEQLAEEQARARQDLPWGPPDGGHDVSFDVSAGEGVPTDRPPRERAKKEPPKNGQGRGRPAGPRLAFVRLVAAALTEARAGEVEAYRDGTVTVTRPLLGTTVYKLSGDVGPVGFVCFGATRTAARQRHFVRFGPADAAATARALIADLNYPARPGEVA